MVWRFLFSFLAIVVLAGVGVGFLQAASAQEVGGRLVTVHDRGVSTVFITHEKTLASALEAQGIELQAHDAVEPSRDEELIAPDYQVNIYRARPVTVIDGAVRQRIMTPFQSTEKIANDAHVALYPEDRTSLEQSSDMLYDGAGLVLRVDRAIDFTLDLYGKKTQVRTHERAVGEMLKQKGIQLGVQDRVGVALETQIAKGMEVRVWREGRQTISEDRVTPFGSEIVYDADRPLGYRNIKTKGVPGVRSVTYEIEIRDGKELYRKEIASIATAEPKKEQLAIGIQGLDAGLKKSKGVVHFTDSKGVTHRETYYDLDMGVVMRSCGQGGRYTVRFDGMKIDADGYIIIAANYALYPKCSVVETSAGPGKVYDTGGFVLRHPHGFDLATDWTIPNGR